MCRGLEVCAELESGKGLIRRQHSVTAAANEAPVSYLPDCFALGHPTIQVAPVEQRNPLAVGPRQLLDARVPKTKGSPDVLEPDVPAPQSVSERLRIEDDIMDEGIIHPHAKLGPFHVDAQCVPLVAGLVGDAKRGQEIVKRPCRARALVGAVMPQMDLVSAPRRIAVQRRMKVDAALRPGNGLIFELQNEILVRLRASKPVRIVRGMLEGEDAFGDAERARLAHLHPAAEVIALKERNEIVRSIPKSRRDERAHDQYEGQQDRNRWEEGMELEKLSHRAALCMPFVMFIIRPDSVPWIRQGRPD